MSSETVERDSSNYDSLMSVRDLINALYDTRDQNAKVFLGILTPDGNNPRMKCSIQAVHGDAWKLPAVEIVGQPLDREKPAHDEAAYRARADRGNLLTILRGLTDDMDAQEGGDTHINGHTVRFVRDMARRADGETVAGETANREAGPTLDVADLIEEIRKQGDVVDELVMSAELAVLYRDDRAFDRLREALAAFREVSGDPR